MQQVNNGIFSADENANIKYKPRGNLPDAFQKHSKQNFGRKKSVIHCLDPDIII